MLDRRTRDLYFGGSITELVSGMSLSQLTALNEANMKGELEEDRQRWLADQEELEARCDNPWKGQRIC